MGLGSGIEGIAGHFILCWGWRRAGYAFLAGALSALAMAPANLFAILFVTIPVLVWLIDSTAADPARSGIRKTWQAFKTGWCFGFGYFLAGLWWIGSAFLVEADQFAWMLPFAVLLLPAGLAIFHGFGVVLARLLWTQDWRRLLVLGASLGLAEYLRGTVATGFPWNLIGYAALTNPLLMQKASVVGVYGVTVLCVPVFGLASLIIARPPGTRASVIAPFIAGLALIGADVGFGWHRLAANPQSAVDGVRMRIVQPNIDQAEKWAADVEERNFGLLIDLSRRDDPKTGAGLAGTTFLVWPESTFPFVLTERADALSALGELLPPGTTLIAGAVRTGPPTPGQIREHAFNSVYSINDRGEITGAADKVHLVPFGEYLPMQELAEAFGVEQLTHLRGGFTAGQRRVTLDGGQAGRFLPLICYEIIFSGQIMPDGERPAWLLNLTNDAWFGSTPGPYQHWHQAVVRGVEEGLPVVRAANSGISSVSDANGRIVAMAGLGERTAFDAELPRAVSATIFSRMGNSLYWAITCMFLATALFHRQSRLQSRH